MQRLLDILFSSLALILLSPILAIIIILLNFTGEGEIFFFQKRIGKSGKEFKLLKFVTMLKDSPNLGTGTVTMRNDPRVLPVGNFLRRTKLNELPQLFNIFIGNMSIIGPRPLTAQTFSSYSIPTQNIIKQVKPGLSGVGSIIFREEEDIMHAETATLEYYRDVIAPYKGLLEEWFVSNRGLYTYFIAIFITIWTVIFPKTRVVWMLLKTLPEPPDELKTALKFKEREDFD